MDIVDTNSSVQYSNESFFCYIENSVNNDESIDDANNPQTGNNYGAHETLLTFDNNLANQTRIAKNVRHFFVILSVSLSLFLEIKRSIIIFQI
jgi:hypothetical protein